MGHSQTDKALSRERILTKAAEQIREGGLSSLSVSRLMRSAELTHGGFYGHFASRSELIEQALARALDEGRAAAAAARGPARGAGFATAVRSYLSRSHRDSPRSGCAIAALAADVARADESVRAVMEPHVEAFIQATAERLQGDEEAAMLAVSAMVGALALARVMTDPKRSDALLRVVRDQLIDGQRRTPDPDHSGGM